MNLYRAFLTLCLVFYSSVASAELIAGTNLSIDMHSAQVFANGAKINMYRIPVTDVTSNQTTYYDAEFLFGVLSDGSVGFTRTTSAAQSTTQLINGQSFIPGNYIDRSGTVTYTLSGPVGLSGGRQQWHLASTTTGKTFSANFVTGSVSGHPYSHDINSNTADGPAFGLSGAADYSPSSGFTSSSWSNGRVVSMTQSGGNVLTIFNYHDIGAQSTPQTSFDLIPN